MLFFIKNYKFKNSFLLKNSITHPCIGKGNTFMSYERMEFLGDNILSFFISDFIYKKYYSYSEGTLSIILSNLINSFSIYKISNMLKTYKFMILDYGEEKIGGRFNKNNIENIFESIICSIYLDSNFITTKYIILSSWTDYFSSIDNFLVKNYKTQLQEIVQKKYNKLIIYKSIINTINFNIFRFFSILISLNDIYYSVVLDKKKKIAEQKAAFKILKLLLI